MSNSRRRALAFALVTLAAPTAALAHAQLQQAVPAVGGTVAASPQELRLRFSEGIEPRFSTVTLAGEAGGAVPLGKAAVDPTDCQGPRREDRQGACPPGPMP